MSGTDWPLDEGQFEPDALLYWLWLAKVLGYGSLYTGRVLDKFGNAKSAWEARDTDAFREAAGAGAVLRANQPENAPETFRAFTRMCAEKHIQILPWDDLDYPKRFRSLPDRPVVLYCTGDPRWLNKPATAGIVGSRSPSSYGLQVAGEFGKGLAQAGAVIISGLAYGLDSIGHRAALKENAPTIAVLGGPIDQTYPAQNRELRDRIEKRGCVISEYPPESKTLGANGFLLRNRLIAALSDILVVIEAKERSGTMSTVAHAERYNRPVFAVPGNIYARNSKGTNALIKEGRARMVREVEDLLDALGISAAEMPETVSAPLSENEQKVLACMDKVTEKGAEELEVKSGLPAPVLIRTLMKLELNERVIKLPGNRYILR